MHRGVAFADFDNDGRIDAVVSVVNGPAKLFRNVSTGESHWLAIRLRGRRANRQGLALSSMSTWPMAATCTTTPPPRLGTLVPAKPWSGSAWVRIDRREDGDPLARRRCSTAGQRRGRPRCRCRRRGQTMTAWRCVIVVLSSPLVLRRRHAQSPGYPAYERANALFVAKKLPEALAADRRSAAPGSETRPRPHVEGETGARRLSPRRGAPVPRAGARARPAVGVCAIPVRARGLSGERS